MARVHQKGNRQGRKWTKGEEDIDLRIGCLGFCSSPSLSVSLSVCCYKNRSLVLYSSACEPCVLFLALAKASKK